MDHAHHITSRKGYEEYGTFRPSREERLYLPALRLYGQRPQRREEGINGKNVLKLILSNNHNSTINYYNNEELSYWAL